MARNKYPEETVKLIIDEAQKLFVEKGYEGTSVQDIINQLGGLSKGAIYHHFKSKEEIFEAVCEKISNEESAYYRKFLKMKGLTGLEKLKLMVKSASRNPNNQIVASISGQFLQDSKFMMNQFHEVFRFVVPEFMLPLIEEGRRDGSIQTDFPQELAELVMMLFNIWLNPIFIASDYAGTLRKLHFLQELFNGMGLPIIDDSAIEQLEAHLRLYNNCPNEA